MISPSRLNGLFIVAITLSFFSWPACASNPSSAAPLTLLWDASRDPNVVGYRLHEGTASKVYTRVEDTGGATAITLTSLAKGVTYYLAVTAYDTNGVESPLSGEITYTIPTSAPRMPALHARLAGPADNGILLSGTAAAGCVYEIQASPDLFSWSVVGAVTVDTNGNYQFLDPALTSFPRRYYRLLLGQGE